MPPRVKPCQVCWKHVSSYRRPCVVCGRYVAPGCWPEGCLFRDYGNFTGLCKECAKAEVPKKINTLQSTTPRAWREVGESGF